MRNAARARTEVFLEYDGYVRGSRRKGDSFFDGFVIAVDDLGRRWAVIMKPFACGQGRRRLRVQPKGSSCIICRFLRVSAVIAYSDML